MTIFSGIRSLFLKTSLVAIAALLLVSFASRPAQAEECVAYANSRLKGDGREEVKNAGCAKNWISAAGVTVSQTPQKGWIVVLTGKKKKGDTESTFSSCGHVMYIESVDGKTLKVSDANWNFDGKRMTNQTFKVNGKWGTRQLSDGTMGLSQYEISGYVITQVKKK